MSYAYKNNCVIKWKKYVDEFNVEKIYTHKNNDMPVFICTTLAMFFAKIFQRSRNSPDDEERMRIGVVFKAVHKFHRTRSRNSFGFFRSGLNCLRFPARARVDGDGRGQGHVSSFSDMKERIHLNASWRGRYSEVAPETQIHIIPSARALCNRLKRIDVTDQ